MPIESDLHGLKKKVMFLLLPVSELCNQQSSL